ncbi:MAG: helix-turn-helix domain-containing protein [Deltaproteobacteria bacterium]|nr:helix-turn-helix domain-containing protein [Deltaproteobacteria bacterium]
MVLNFNEIFARMLEAGGIKNSSQMAKTLGISPQAISNYRKKGLLPAGMVMEFAAKFGISVDWLLTGRGETFNKSNLSGKASRPSAITMDEAGLAPANDTGKSGPCHLWVVALNPDEIIYVGKLLKILRGAERSAAKSLTVSIDAFLMSDVFQTRE